MFKDIAIIIPSLDPDEKLINLLKSIRNSDVKSHIIIVNDGSGSEYDKVFKEAQIDDRVILLNHGHNIGKGQALKTAFQYIDGVLPDVCAAVTIDSDGQHTVVDMSKCINAHYVNKQNIIFGARHFGEDIPFRSKFGNVLTRKILNLSTGIKLEDTQTGLRVIPREYLRSMLDIQGERFEYEMNMILWAKQNDIFITEVPISTIYINDNETSHFKIFSDSIAIYSVFLKYIFSSVIAFLVDILIFTVILNLLVTDSFTNITIATIIARIISSFVNYFVNKNFVFKGNSRLSLIKYFILVIVQMFVSSSLVTLLTNIIIIVHPTIIKIFVDAFLFFVNYFIQKKYIFNEEGTK